jgi:hypothetical protein
MINAAIGLNATCGDKVFRGASKKLAEALIVITEDLCDYHPLTVRQAYYQAVSRGLISNNLNEYQRVSRILTTLRREELISWDAFEDRSRRTVEKRGVSDVTSFVRNQCESFLDWRYYHRCRVQEQEYYVEISVEKDALSTVFEEAVWPYCCRLNIMRGQSSADLVNRMAGRFKDAQAKGQHIVLLHFGDFDPSGVRIPEAVAFNLAHHHQVDVDMRRVALTPEQIDTYKLPESLDAAKKSDPNYRHFVTQYDDARPVELDALHPGILKDLIRQSLESVLDMSNFQEQLKIEEMERAKLKEMRRDVMAFLRRHYPAIIGGGE